MDENENFALRLTDSARRICTQIAERAIDRGMIAGELNDDTAAMLAVLSLLRWERKLGRAALEAMGVPIEPLARDLDELILFVSESCKSANGPNIEVTPSGQPRLIVDVETPSQILIVNAEQEANDLNHNYLGTEHLLLAAIRGACAEFRETLDRHAVKYGEVKRAIVELLDRGK